MILAALSPSVCRLRGALWADDTQVMVDSLQRLGFDVRVSPDPSEPCNRQIEIHGCNGRIPARKADLFVGNAGTAARFLTALVALGHGEYKLTGDPRMSERPMEDLIQPLRQLGVRIDAPSDRIPATIHANGLPPGQVSISSNRSSQFASALLLVAQHAKLAVALTEPEEPGGYIEMTRRMITEFTPDYRIEPDLSSASYFLAARFITGNDITVASWPGNSLQIDGRFPDYLPPPAMVSRQRELGDSVMTLAMCALFGARPLRIVDAGRLRLQECDRLSAMATELRRIGAIVEEAPDGLTVWPAAPGSLQGAEIETYNDHRMAMCFATVGLRVPGIRILNPGCVNKTFPNFFEKLRQLQE
jgi:3-phosphoshikimate 1-carboxyvinyltransferase